MPDAGHKALIELCREDPAIRAITLTTEEEGIALLAGAWLGGAKGALLAEHLEDDATEVSAEGADAWLRLLPSSLNSSSSRKRAGTPSEMASTIFAIRRSVNASSALLRFSFAL